MRSMSRYTSNMQTSVSYINENRFNELLLLFSFLKMKLFDLFSMESGFGSDIFDNNGADTNRHIATFERVRDLID